MRRKHSMCIRKTTIFITYFNFVARTLTMIKSQSENGIERRTKEKSTQETESCDNMRYAIWSNGIVNIIHVMEMKYARPLNGIYDRWTIYQWNCLWIAKKGHWTIIIVKRVVFLSFYHCVSHFIPMALWEKWHELVLITSQWKLRRTFYVQILLQFCHVHLPNRFVLH